MSSCVLSMGPRTPTEFVRAQDQAMAMQNHRELLNIQASGQGNDPFLEALHRIYENLGKDLSSIDICASKRLYNGIYIDEDFEALAEKPGSFRRWLGSFRRWLNSCLGGSSRSEEVTDGAGRDLCKQTSIDFFEAVDKDTGIYRHVWGKLSRIMNSAGMIMRVSGPGLCTGLPIIRLH